MKNKKQTEYKVVEGKIARPLPPGWDRYQAKILKDTERCWYVYWIEGPEFVLVADSYYRPPDGIPHYAHNKGKAKGTRYTKESSLKKKIEELQNNPNVSRIKVVEHTPILDWRPEDENVGIA